ncbi:MAG TPA: methyltransferase domain-containing protein, partial [Actinomycetes bacterium]|nr:methyltransferase domain-containing protein [Actinomycetes bacterium]
MTTVPTQSNSPEIEVVPSADDLGMRLMLAALGSFELLAIQLGTELGLYQALQDGGPATTAEVAARAGVHERYAREWLEQQAVSSFLTVSGDGPERVFTLPAATAEVLLDTSSLAYSAPMARIIAGVAVKMPDLVAAYRTGGGVSWEDFGAVARESQAAMNRPWFEQRLGAALGGVPEVDEVLRRPGARIADLGSGGGWSSIALARAYPQARVDGYDVDQPSVDMATANAAGAGVSDRVRFHHADVASADIGEGYDAVFAFECVHDLPAPVEFLATARAALRPGGLMIVMDEAVQPEFTAPGDE